MKKTISLIMLFFLIAVLSACQDTTGKNFSVKPDSTKDGKYSTMMPMSSLEYSIYMQKQSTIFTNELMSRMNAAQLSTALNDNKTELKLVETGIQSMEAAKEEFTLAMPPEGRDDDRQTMMLAMDAAIKHMEEYEEKLKKGSDVTGYVKIFESDFNEISNLAIVYPE